MRYFDAREFRCKCPFGDCTAPLEILSALAERLDALRADVGRPLIVSSGLRCERHNRLVRGVSASEHLTGEAADIVVASPQERFQLLKAAVKLFDRIGVMKRALHLGVGTGHPSSVAWLYPCPTCFE